MSDTATMNGARQRPGVVTAAVWLLYVAAALQVIAAVITVSQLAAMRDTYNRLFAGTVPGAGDRVAALSGALTVGLGLLFAIGYVVLAVFVGRGKRPARFVTWAVALVSVCCTGTTLVSTTISVSNNVSGAAGGPTGAEIQKAINAALPSWYQPALTTITAGSMVAMVTVVVLLALPMANPYFRKPQPPVRIPPAQPPTEPTA